MSPEEEAAWFAAQKALLESAYLAADNPRAQSGFARDEQSWELARRPIASAIHRSGSFLDIGCASGLLMECVVRWTAEAGHRVEPYGLDISEKLVELSRRRLPAWKDRFFVGNALDWSPPGRFDFVRTELLYVPAHLRRPYVERLLAQVVAEQGRLIICSYGTSRRPSPRVEPLVEELRDWGYPVKEAIEARDPDNGIPLTRVVWIDQLEAGS
jgi:SAM-dependent methyltransferase